MNPDTLIEIDHVTFGYDASRTILNDVSLTFARGKVTAILGGSGCGKTTLAGALARQLSAPCLDADDFHPARNVEKMRAGMPLTDDDRQPWLASLNAELRSRALDGQRVVLACSALRQRYRDALAADIPAVHWIFLDGSAAEIAARMRATSRKPI